MAKLKIKTKKNKTDVLSYRDGAEKIREYVLNFSNEAEKILGVEYNEDYFIRHFYRKTQDKTSKIIDDLSVRFLRSIKENSDMDKPFEYFMYGVMNESSKYNRGDERFFSVQACACRLVNTHQYWVMAKNQNKDGVKELIKRGWGGDTKTK